MATLVELNCVSPTIGEDVWLAPTAVLIGDVRIGDRVTVGHGALLEGCVIGDGTVIGMGSIVLHHARVGPGTMLAAGTVVPERTTIAPSVLAAGVPAREKKPLGGSAERWMGIAADDYQGLRERYLGSAIARRFDGGRPIRTTTITRS
jgi:carbonic anhydrase/acetyltransferase-like protein (isoleucine patch superfamily)